MFTGAECHRAPSPPSVSRPSTTPTRSKTPDGADPTETHRPTTTHQRDRDDGDDRRRRRPRPPLTRDYRADEPDLATGSDVVPTQCGHRQTGEQFTDPEAAARSFVEDYLGFDDPPLGAFRPQGDDTGEIDVFTRGEDGTVRSDLVRSTLSLRRAGDLWAVTAAQSDSIVVDSPAPLGAVGDPVVVDGRGRGFEALIIVSVRGEGMGAGQELARGNTLAGCCEALEPFHIELPVEAPAGSPGSLLLQNDDPTGFGVPDFTVVPVHFVAGTGSQASDERSVTLFWSDAAGALQPNDRTVRLSQGILRGTIQQYLFGPTSAERDAGLSSGLDRGRGLGVVRRRPDRRRRCGRLLRRPPVAQPEHVDVGEQRGPAAPAARRCCFPVPDRRDGRVPRRRKLRRLLGVAPSAAARRSPATIPGYEVPAGRRRPPGV